MRKKCLKQVVTCRIDRDDGTSVLATNSCNVGNFCPRVEAGSKSGEGYELCYSIHAEIVAAHLAEESSDSPGHAYLWGHSYICKDCQDALRAVNVHTFTILDGDSP